MSKVTETPVTFVFRFEKIEKTDCNRENKKKQSPSDKMPDKRAGKRNKDTERDKEERGRVGGGKVICFI